MSNAGQSSSRAKIPLQRTLSAEAAQGDWVGRRAPLNLDKPQKSSVFASLPPISMAALVTATLMYPVDLIRALKMSSAAEGKAQPLMQMLRTFHAQHGLKGFATQGVAPEMLRATYMRVLKFFLFPICHENMFDCKPSEGTIATKVAAAAVATLPEGLSIQPIEVSKIALQLDKDNKHGNRMSNVLRDIVKHRGVTGLYIGYFGVQYRQTSWTCAYFASLQAFTEQSKAILPEGYEKTASLLGGFGAGMFGAVFNTPGDVIRSSLLKERLAQPPVKHEFSLGLCASGVKSFFDFGAKIVATNGIGALYSGFPFKALHLGGSGALLAMLVPTFKDMLGVPRM